MALRARAASRNDRSPSRGRTLRFDQYNNAGALTGDREAACAKDPGRRGRGKPRPKPGEVSLRSGLTIAAVLAVLARLLLLLAGFLLRILSALLAALTGLLLLLAGLRLRILSALLVALVLHGVLLCPLAWR